MNSFGCFPLFGARSEPRTLYKTFVLFLLFYSILIMSQQIRKHLIGLRNAARQIKRNMSSGKINAIQKKIVLHAKTLQKLKGPLIKNQLRDIKDVLFTLAAAKDFQMNPDMFTSLKKKLARAANGIAVKCKITRHS